MSARSFYIIVLIIVLSRIIYITTNICSIVTEYYINSATPNAIYVIMLIVWISILQDISARRSIVLLVIAAFLQQAADMINMNYDIYLHGLELLTLIMSLYFARKVYINTVKYIQIKTRLSKQRWCIIALSLLLIIGLFLFYGHMRF